MLGSLPHCKLAEFHPWLWICLGQKLRFQPKISRKSGIWRRYQKNISWVFNHYTFDSKTICRFRQGLNLEYGKYHGKDGIPLKWRLLGCRLGEFQIYLF